MRESEVPQDAGLFDGMRGLTYAVNKSGRYIQVSTEGWAPVNYANELAREKLDLNLRLILEKIRVGSLSPLAYHMAKAKMDEWLLARYAGVSKRKVKRHLKPGGFARLTEQQMKTYAEIFGISVQALRIPSSGQNV
ncbi:MAG: hypothetical protein JXN60_05770 [Lentisphaerae bacterium]|nr:hypothetical protein [Lentisphaerota bacterium]